jgi:hypothetical protein
VMVSAVCAAGEETIPLVAPSSPVSGLFCVDSESLVSTPGLDCVGAASLDPCPLVALPGLVSSSASRIAEVNVGSPAIASGGR